MPRGSKQINHLFAIFCRVNGFRLATSATDDGGYALDYYRGYQIVRLSKTGGQYEPFGSRRYSVKEFSAILSFGIDLARMKEEGAQQRYPGRPASQYLNNPSRKDFELIAGIIRAFGESDLSDVAQQKLAFAFADALAATNPRFDRERFLRASGVSTTPLNVKRNPGGMTLDAWSRKHNVRVHHSETGYKCRVFERDIPSAEAKRELYQLSDYVVSATISGPAFALSPRTHVKENPHHRRGDRRGPFGRGGKRPYEGATYHVEVWEERDRLHVALWRRWMNEDDIVADWWDDDARQMFDDGFFKRGRELSASVIAYAKEVGVINA